MKDESNCKKQKWCGFEITLENDEVQKEVCRYCGKRVIYRKIDGKVDSNKYLRDHVRDFCQPWGATKRVYLELYGTKAIKEVEVIKDAKENAAKSLRERPQRFKEMRNIVKRSSSISVNKSLKE